VRFYGWQRGEPMGLPAWRSPESKPLAVFAARGFRQPVLKRLSQQWAEWPSEPAGSNAVH
jgi:hypothetical protein